MPEECDNCDKVKLYRVKLVLQDGVKFEDGQDSIDGWYCLNCGIFLLQDDHTEKETEKETDEVP